MANLSTSSNGVTPEQIDQMKAQYQAHPGGGTGTGGQQQPLTQWGIFPLQNILDLLLANGIAQSDQTIGALHATPNLGIKTVFGQHVDPSDCPGGNPDYIGHNTIILVASRFDPATGSWIDFLSADGSALGSSGGDGGTVNAGEGTDRANLCPPQCG